ncbi:MAG TPA: MATE family efflux transporter [Polyangiales bacterium]|nr:MATE family efflux transporter [Polyangiales bacterium]
MPHSQADSPKIAVSPPRASVWQLAWPSVITNLLQSTVGLTDVKVVGTLGASAVAAATTGHRLFFALQAVLMGVSVGTTALVARSWGAGDRHEASQVLRSSLRLALGLAVGMSLIGVMFAAQFAGMFGLPDDARDLAATYMRWISAFTCVFAIGMMFFAALRGAGQMRTPLWTGAITNLLNILFLYLLVYGGWGFPKVGIRGAALAGGLAFSAVALLLLALWRSGRLGLPLVAADGKDRERVRALLRVGMPAAAEQMVVQGGFIAFTFIVARYFGTHALAAYGIGVQILSLSFVIGFGFSIAASTLVGQHLGARDPVAAAQSGWRAMRLAIASMSVLALLIVGCAEQIARAMLDEPEVVRLTTVFIQLLGAAQPLMAIDYALSGALRGAGDTRFPLLSTFLGLICGRVFLAAVFTVLQRPVEWIYAALLADYSIKAVLLIVRFRSERWRSAMPARG